MARIKRQRTPKPRPDTVLDVMLREYMQALAIQNYSENTISNRTFHLMAFLQWCQERGLTEPVEITRPVLERYQRYLFHYRKKNGEPMSFRTQHSRLVPLRM
jgi:integrase/recombinase XerD